MDVPSWSFGGSFVGHNMNGMNESTVNSHRWELIVNERGIGGNVIVSTLNPITVGRSTWRLKNGGQLDLRISRESLRLVDMGELEVTSLRKEKPCVRYRTWLAGPWIDLKCGETVRVVGGVSFELVPKSIGFQVKDLRLAWPPLFEAASFTPFGAPLEDAASSPATRALFSSEWGNPAREVTWSTSFFQGEAAVSSSAPLVSPAGSQPSSQEQGGSLVGPSCAPPVSAAGSQPSSQEQGGSLVGPSPSATGWIKRRKTTAPMVTAKTILETWEESPSAGKEEEEQEERGSLAGSSQGGSLPLERVSRSEIKLDHRCEKQPLLLGYCAATLDIGKVVSVVDPSFRREEARPNPLSENELICFDTGVFDDFFSWRARQAMRQGLACTFTADGLKKPAAAGGKMQVALGFYCCSLKEKALVHVVEALRRLLGDQCVLKNTVEQCVTLQANRDRLDPVISFNAASESELMLLDALNSLQATELPAARQPRILQTMLKHHQLQGLGWLLQREVAPPELPPFWLRIDRFGSSLWHPRGASAWGTKYAARAWAFLLVVYQWNSTHAQHYFQRFPRDIAYKILNLVPIDCHYKHQLTQVETTRRPRPSRGGILADDMGVGKTLQMIALLCANSSVRLTPQPRFIADHSIFDSLLQRNGDDDDDDDDERDGGGGKHPCKLQKRDLQQEEDFHVNLDPNEPRRATLIVCPLSVMSNWVDQIETHVGVSVLRVLVHHGSKKVQHTKEELEEADVVITTYGTMSLDFNEERQVPGLLSTVKWRRVILDEAHYIRNPKTKASKSAIRIDAWFRWALTGTPLQNNIRDLQPLFAFINEEVFSDRDSYRNLIATPIKRGLGEGFIRLRTIMLSACLRRTKDSKNKDGVSLVQLPPKTIFTQRLQQDDVELCMYRVLDEKARAIFQALMRNPTMAGLFLMMLLRLRQTCDHSSLCKDLEKSLDRIRELVDKGEATDAQALLSNFDLNSVVREGCSACTRAEMRQQEGDLWISTVCFHVFCAAHRQEVMTSGSCCVCAEFVDGDSELHLAPPAASGGGGAAAKRRGHHHGGDAPVRPSAKMSEVLRICRQVLEGGGRRAKVVIFSQWTSFLNLLQDYLSAELNCRLCRLDGTMSAGERSIAMRAFNSEDKGSPAIILVSLMAGGVGVNLIGACNLIIADPWWNPAVEDQAIDRVYRIGQTEPVRVYRLIIANSVEERLLRLHAGKRSLAAAALVLKSPEELSNIKLRDMSFLFGVMDEFGGMAEDGAAAGGVFVGAGIDPVPGLALINNFGEGSNK